MQSQSHGGAGEQQQQRGAHRHHQLPVGLGYRTCSMTLLEDEVSCDMEHSLQALHRNAQAVCPDMAELGFYVFGRERVHSSCGLPSAMSQPQLHSCTNDMDGDLQHLDNFLGSGGLSEEVTGDDRSRSTHPSSSDVDTVDTVDAALSLLHPLQFKPPKGPRSMRKSASVPKLNSMGVWGMPHALQLDRERGRSRRFTDVKRDLLKKVATSKSDEVLLDPKRVKRILANRQVCTGTEGGGGA